MGREGGRCRVGTVQYLSFRTLPAARAYQQTLYSAQQCACAAAAGTQRLAHASAFPLHNKQESKTRDGQTTAQYTFFKNFKNRQMYGPAPLRKTHCLAQVHNPACILFMCMQGAQCEKNIKHRTASLDNNKQAADRRRDFDSLGWTC